jgi:hypothetical protein
LFLIHSIWELVPNTRTPTFFLEWEKSYSSLPLWCGGVMCGLARRSARPISSLNRSFPSTLCNRVSQVGFYLITPLSMFCLSCFRIPGPSSSSPSSFLLGLDLPLCLLWWTGTDPRWARRTFSTSSGVVYYMEAGGWFRAPSMPWPHLLVTCFCSFISMSEVTLCSFILLLWPSSSTCRCSFILWTRIGFNIWWPSLLYVRGTYASNPSSPYGDTSSALSCCRRARSRG